VPVLKTGQQIDGHAAESRGIINAQAACTALLSDDPPEFVKRVYSCFGILEIAHVRTAGDVLFRNIRNIDRSETVGKAISDITKLTRGLAAPSMLLLPLSENTVSVGADRQMNSLFPVVDVSRQQPMAFHAIAAVCERQ
jgi:hypothetical protein